MRIKIAALLLALLFLAGCASRVDFMQEEETSTPTLLTASDFGENEYAAGIYRQLINDYAQNHDVRLSDSSALTGEAYVAQIIRAFAAGDEPDVFYLPDASYAQTMIDNGQVVSVQEICTAYPQYAANISSWLMAALVDGNGKNWYVPVQGSYAALFCNRALFRENNISLPTTWSKLRRAIESFASLEITPVAAAFSDRSGLWIDHLLMACDADAHLLPIAQQTQPPTVWSTSVIQLLALSSQGTFQDGAATATHTAARTRFLEGKAAMILDDCSLMRQIENPDDMIVLPLPWGHRITEDEQTRLIVSADGGYFISRKAWNSDTLREAAVSFVMAMSSTQAILQLNGDGSGWAPILTDQLSRELCTSDLAYDAIELSMKAQARLSIRTRMTRSSWNMFSACIPQVLQGSMTPQELITNIWEMNQP